MKITVLFFASLKDFSGKSRVEVDYPAENITVQSLQALLGDEFPGMSELLARALVSINGAYALGDDLVPADSEVAFFPPVSGGDGSRVIFTQVTFDPLNLDALVEKITLPTTGAVCMFTGVVRGETRRGEGQITTALEYESYIPMAESKMMQVAEEIIARWSAVEGIVIIQRIGRLKVGTPTVFIACSASHRDTGAFEAARYGIDRLKEIVPIWKKEIGPNGETWIEGEYIPRAGD